MFNILYSSIKTTRTWYTRVDVRTQTVVSRYFRCLVLFFPFLKKIIIMIIVVVIIIIIINIYNRGSHWSVLNGN